ncbi:hypothetical protein Hanom_Chr02g00144561 [Helianthus anomalus]
MGWGWGVGWVQTPKSPPRVGLAGFWRGPLGGGFSLGVGRGYPHDMAEPHWPRALVL